MTGVEEASAASKSTAKKPSPSAEAAYQKKIEESYIHGRYATKDINGRSLFPSEEELEQRRQRFRERVLNIEDVDLDRLIRDGYALEDLATAEHRNRKLYWRKPKELNQAHRRVLHRYTEYGYLESVQDGFKPLPQPDFVKALEVMRDDEATNSSYISLRLCFTSMSTAEKVRAIGEMGVAVAGQDLLRAIALHDNVVKPESLNTDGPLAEMTRERVEIARHRSVQAALAWVEIEENLTALERNGDRT